MGPNSTEPRVVEVLEGLHDAVRADGAVFHLVATHDFGGSDGDMPMWQLESWVNLAHRQSREHFQLGPDAELELANEMTILADAETYYIPESDDVDTAPNPCPGLGPWTAAYLAPLCPGFLDRYNAAVVDTIHEGEAAVSLVFSPRDPDDLGTSGYVLGRENELILAADTFRPLALIARDDDPRTTTDFVRTGHINTEAMSFDELPTDLFEPESLGYVPPDPAGTAQASQSVRPLIWFGESLTLESGATLELQHVHLERPGTGPWHRTVLEYDDLSDSSSGVVSVGIHTLEEWEAFANAPVFRAWWNNACVARAEEQLGQIRLVSFSGHFSRSTPAPPGRVAPPPGQQRTAATPSPTASGASAASGPSAASSPSADQASSTSADPTSTSAQSAACPDTRPNAFMAHVFFPDAVVTLNAAHCLPCSPPPLPADVRSVEGLNALAVRLERAE